MYTITDACTTCGKCLPECPIDAIEADEPTFTITDLCCDFAECVVVCPEDAIVPLEEAVDNV